MPATEERHADHELSRLRQENERLLGIIGSATDAIITVDQHQRITLFNAAAEQMFRSAAADAIGRPLDAFIPSRFREVHQEHIRRFAETGVTRRTMGAHQQTLLAVRADGVEFPVEATISQVTVGGQRLFTAIVRDVTQRRRAEEALEHHARELARSNEELERFAYVASHDLQEPMRTVSSFVQLLARRYQGRLDSTADEYIQFITDGAARMRTLVSDLLEYSRVNSRGGALAATDANAVLRKVLEGLQGIIEAERAEVSSDTLPTVVADQTQLGQVFQNLIGNAIKFHGPDVPRIHVSAVRRGEEWVFSVRDNGIGIAPEYHERIFIIFQRLHTIEEYGGTGMGLAICKRIVERHGGRMWLESEPQRGSTFFFSVSARGRRP
jgi:PAS domain S-box-containing protein